MKGFDTMKVKVQFVKEEIIEISDVYEIMVEDYQKAMLGEPIMSIEEWRKLREQLETKIIDKIPFDPTKFYLAGIYNLNDEPLTEF